MDGPDAIEEEDDEAAEAKRRAKRASLSVVCTAWCACLVPCCARVPRCPAVRLERRLSAVRTRLSFEAGSLEQILTRAPGCDTRLRAVLADLNEGKMSDRQRKLMDNIAKRQQKVRIARRLAVLLCCCSCSCVRPLSSRVVVRAMFDLLCAFFLPCGWLPLPRSVLILVVLWLRVLQMNNMQNEIEVIRKKEFSQARFLFDSISAVMAFVSVSALGVLSPVVSGSAGIPR